MAQDIAQAFVKQFESEVHLAYQQMGTKLRATIRSKTGVVGASTAFQKVGRGTATTKTRHGLVDVMNLDHTPVECALSDYYAGDWVDALDELKTNINERQVVASAGAYALGRKTDELILDAMNSATNIVASETTGITKSKVLAALEIINSNDIPDDGRRFCIVGVKQWNELLAMDEFVSSDYVGAGALVNGTESRKWLGINWIMMNGLPETDGVRSCFMYHASAIGHASGQDVKSDISWNGERAAHFVCNSMSQGAALIDNDGIVKIECAEA